MYNPVNLSVTTSPLLTKGLYAVHAGLILTCLAVLSSNFHGAVLLVLCPLLVVQSLHIKKLWRGEFVFCKPRQWQFFNGQARLKQAQNWLAVDVVAHQVWPSCVVIKYRAAGLTAKQAPLHWQWDIFMYDACDQECFRQVIALMRCDYHAKGV